MQVSFYWIHKHLLCLLYDLTVLPGKIKMPDHMGKKTRHSSSCSALVLLRAVTSLCHSHSLLGAWMVLDVPPLFKRAEDQSVVSGNIMCTDKRALTQQGYGLWLQLHYLVYPSLCMQREAATIVLLSRFWFSCDLGSSCAWPDTELFRWCAFCWSPDLRSCW